MNAHLTPSPDGPTDSRLDGRSAVAFAGTTPGRTAAVRAGILLGTGLLLAIGAAVAMGASPAPPASAGGGTSGAQSEPGPFGFGPGGHGGDGWARGGHGHGGGHAFGHISVTAVSGSSISLATDDGWTRTITVTAATTITRAGLAATLADISVGDTIRFAQTRSDDGTYTITAIDIVLPRAAGVVTAVTADGITITRRDGTSQTIQTTGSTTYRVGRADGTRADVTVGSRIAATGQKASDGTLTATTIHVHLPHVMGTVTATTADTITISRPDGTAVTIHVAGDTTIAVGGRAGAAMADVKVGMVLVAEGAQRSDGSIDAVAIRAGEFGPWRGHGKGHVRHGPAASATPDALGSQG